MRLNIHPGITHDTKVTATHIGMAHFAMTGPPNTFCSQCDYRSKGGCSKFIEMTKSKLRMFPAETPSCKYFAPKQLQLDPVRDED
jgi:hypothetical protein